MSLFEGSFLLLDRVARGVNGLWLKDFELDDYVIGGDDSSLSSRPTVYQRAEARTAGFNDDERRNATGHTEFSATTVSYQPTPRIVDVIGLASTSAITLPASSVAVAGDIDVVAIYGGFTSTIHSLPSGYYDLGGATCATCSCRVAWKVLTGPSTPMSLTDLGETNGAVRFIIRGASNIGGYYMDAGLYGTISNFTCHSSSNPRMVLMGLMSYSLSSYSDLITTDVDETPFVRIDYPGTYGFDVAYSTYTGPVTTSFTASTHEGNESSAVFFWVCAENHNESPIEIQNVLLCSEAKDTASLSVSSSSTSRTASLVISEASDVPSFNVYTPKTALASVDIAHTSFTSATHERIYGWGAEIFESAIVSVDVVVEKNSSGLSVEWAQAVPVVAKGAMCVFDEHTHLSIAATGYRTDPYAMAGRVNIQMTAPVVAYGTQLCAFYGVAEIEQISSLDVSVIKRLKDRNFIYNMKSSQSATGVKGGQNVVGFDSTSRTSAFGVRGRSVHCNPRIVSKELVSCSAVKKVSVDTAITLCSTFFITPVKYPTHIGAGAALFFNNASLSVSSISAVDEKKNGRAVVLCNEAVDVFVLKDVGASVDITSELLVDFQYNKCSLCSFNTLCHESCSSTATILTDYYGQSLIIIDVNGVIRKSTFEREIEALERTATRRNMDFSRVLGSCLHELQSRRRSPGFELVDFESFFIDL